MLFVTCIVINLIHWLVRPYSSKVLNIYDGLVLQVMTAIIALQIIYFDNFDSVIPIAAAFVLVMLPLTMLIIMAVVLNAELIKRFYISCCFGLKLINSKKASLGNTDSGREYDITVDQELRQRSETVVTV